MPARTSEYSAAGWEFSQRRETHGPGAGELSCGPLRVPASATVPRVGRTGMQVP